MEIVCSWSNANRTHDEDTVYDPDKPRLIEVTEAERDLFSCVRGDHGLVWGSGMAAPLAIYLASMEPMRAEVERLLAVGGASVPMT